MTRTLLVLQHVAWEEPGLVTRSLARVAGHVPVTTRTVLDDVEPSLPRVQDLAGLVVMGGPMSADDDALHPGLRAERHLLADAVAADVPVLGVCLGMQLLAVALGAQLHHRHGTEIGFAPVDLVQQDPALGALGPDPTVLHWHGDAVDLPEGATLLASTVLTPVQAFRAGSALGLQFHVEVEPGLMAAWLREPAMVGNLPASVRTHVAADADRVLPSLVPRALTALDTFAADVRRRA